MPARPAHFDQKIRLELLEEIPPVQFIKMHCVVPRCAVVFDTNQSVRICLGRSPPHHGAVFNTFLAVPRYSASSTGVGNSNP